MNDNEVEIVFSGKDDTGAAVASTIKGQEKVGKAAVDNFNKARQGAALLDQKIKDTEGVVLDLAHQFAVTGDQDVYKKLRDERSALSSLRSVRSELGKVADAEQEVGKEADKAGDKNKKAADETKTSWREAFSGLHTGEASFDSLKDKAKEFVSASRKSGGEAERSWKTTIGNMGKLATAGLAGAGLAAGALFVEGIKMGIEKGRVDALLSAQLGGELGTAKDVGKLTGKIFADNFGDSMDQVAEAIKFTIQNGLVNSELSTDDEIRKITEKVLTVGQVIGEESGAVTRAASQMVRTGLAQNASDALDMITKASQEGLNKSDDLLDTLNEYGTQWRKLGITGPEALGLIRQALQAGARDSDIAGDALKELSIRAVDGSTTTAAGFKLLGLNADTMAEKFGKGGQSARGALDETLKRLGAIKDPVKQSQAAVDLFGTQFEDLGAALGAMNLDRATNSFGTFSGSVQKANDTISSSTGATTDSYFRKWKQTLSDTGSEFTDWLAKNSMTPEQMGQAFSHAAGVARNAWNSVARWFSGPFVGFFRTAWFGVRAATGSAIDWIEGRWNAAIGWFKKIPGRVSGAFSGMFDGVKGAFRSAINWVIGKWNDFSLPGLNTPFGSFGGFNTPNIGYLASGGVGSGWNVVNERQAELVRLPSGSMVYPSTAHGGGVGGGDSAVAGMAMLNVSDSVLFTTFLPLLANAVRKAGARAEILGIDLSKG